MQAYDHLQLYLVDTTFNQILGHDIYWSVMSQSVPKNILHLRLIQGLSSMHVAIYTKHL